MHVEPSTLSTALVFGVLWFVPIGAWVLRRRIAESRGGWRFLGRAFQTIGVLLAIIAVPATAAIFMGAGLEVIEVAQDMWKFVSG